MDQCYLYISENDIEVELVQNSILLDDLIVTHSAKVCMIFIIKTKFCIIGKLKVTSYAEYVKLYIGPQLALV